MTNRTVAAVFDRYEDAARAVSKLESAGVAHSDISIVSNDAGQRDRFSGTSVATMTRRAPVPPPVQGPAPRLEPAPDSLRALACWQSPVLVP